jgi:pimeloyl-ACP methyl ester carboxylesterase
LATFVLIHGAGDSAWYWHLVEPELRHRGHDVVAMDLPCDDDSAGLAEYADAAVDAVGDRKDLVVVAQSFGGFTAPLVCERTQAELLVLVAAMIPAPGEAPNDYWANTGYEAATRESMEDDKASGDNEDATAAIFFHDVSPDLVAEAMKRERNQSTARMGEPWPLKSWPDVPTRVLLCRDDRLFPADYMRRVVRERLSITPDEIDGGHCIALSRPQELADRLDAFASGR